jgi:hypothetical protein
MGSVVLFNEVAAELKVFMLADNEAEMVGQHSLSRQSLPLWRNRDYVLLWGGQATSSGTVLIFGGCLLVLAMWTTLSRVFSRARS